VGEFEVLERDGLARIGRLSTPHGPLETPALLPVVHPDPSRQPIPPREIRRKFGLSAVITSSYITWRTPDLKARAEKDGIHGLLDFDGPVMTDSGAFQQHAYGHVEVGPEEIHAFQRRIGSDISTVLDIFVEPEATHEVAEAGVEATTKRALEARALNRGLLAVPVQGGLFGDLRYRSAVEASEIGDVLAVGGVVPLLEQYRFPALARLLLSARPGLAPERLVHLFGTGHPISFAFAALFGVDVFDSSSYHKFARRNCLLFPEGTVDLATLREPVCDCALCAEHPLTEVARWPAPERERHLAEHNLRICATEIARVRQAIKDGSLWELAERRATGHPGLLAGLRAAVRGARVFLPTEPESRRSFRVVGSTSGLRPSVIRFLARLEHWKADKGPFESMARAPIVPSILRRLPPTRPDGSTIRWEVATPFGGVPFELSEVYPVGCLVAPDEFEEPAEPTEERGRWPPVPEGVDALSEWTARHVRGVFEWVYGAPTADAIVARRLEPVRSKKTGRLRILRSEGRPAFIVGNDGLPRPTFLGGQILHDVLPTPHGRIIVSPDAAEFVAQGRSLFSRFVEGGDSGLSPGSSALLVDRSDALLAVGILLLAPLEMGRLSRGVAVRVTAHAKKPVPPDDPEEGLAPVDGAVPRAPLDE